MCMGIYVLGEHCETQGQLADALGVGLSDLPLERHYDDSARDRAVCLCPIDFSRAVSAVGLVLYRTNCFDANTFVPGHDYWWPTDEDE